MGKPKNERQQAENEAKAYAKFIDSSPYKLNLVAELIRGKPAGKALVDLDFSTKRTAKDVKKVLQSAIANAENNHSLDVDRLYVSEATVGKQMVIKRWMARGRGKAGSIQKFFSNLTIVVREKAE
jgi:large subunit ribosomal protein L22